MEENWMQISRRLMAFGAACFLVLASTLTAGIGFTGNIPTAHAASGLPSSYFAPYQDVTIGSSLQSVTQATGQKYYTLAFIGSNGCNAEWAGTIPLNQTSTYLPHLDSDISYIRGQGGDIVISFGGAAGQELAQACTSSSSLQAQYQAVVTKYNATHLDFDIESGQQGDSTTYDRRNIALAALQAANPVTDGSTGGTGRSYYYIQNRYSGLVLDDTGWSTSNGTIIQQWSEVSGQANQQWNLLQA